MFWQSAEAYQTPFNFHPKMKILRAVGFGIALIIIRILMPEVFNGLEHALVEFFSALTKTMEYGTSNLGGAASAFPMPRV